MESLGGRESRRKTLYTMRKEGGERNITPHDKKARKEKKKQDRMGELWKEDNVILFSLHKSYNLF